MSLISLIVSELGEEWLPAIYKAKIRIQRTRAVSLSVPERENQCTILHTLLGIELKVGKRRFACPDLATARYMRVFARMGCCEFAIPYDITRISGAADELETAWHRTFVLLEKYTADSTKKSSNISRSKLIKAMRLELTEIGPGDVMPSFDRPTRQR